MSKFNISSHDFGLVEFNSNHCINVQYLGDSQITTGNFRAPCGCTSYAYYPNEKKLVVCLNMNNSPVKEASVICNLPEGQEIIKLKGTIK